jgi:anti-anti-sigma regulatory factor/HAMP domain-containing protein
MRLKLTIRDKILIMVATVAMVAAGASAFVAYRIANDALEEQAFNKLTAVREMKANQVEDYFRQIKNQVITFSQNRMIVNAMKSFKAAFNEVERELELDASTLKDMDTELSLYYINEFLPRLNKNATDPGYLPDYFPDDKIARIIQHMYIVDNTYDTGQKHLLANLDSQATYSAVHRLYHPVIRDYLERFGYYDIFLVDIETGNLVYTVFKEVDYGTSLLSGPYRDTNFARAFKVARDANHDDFVRLVDFEPYHPSYNNYASFIASPIFDGDEKIGILLFQMPVDRINDIMTNKQAWSSVGLGESGETYIVGRDFKIRNQPRFLIEDKDRYLDMIRDLGVAEPIVNRIASLDNAIGLQEVRTEGTRAALAGRTGTEIFRDYRGVPVLSAFRPLAIPDVDWVIMSEIAEAEAFSAVERLRNTILGGLLLLTALSLLVAIAFSRTLTRPLTKLSEKASELAQGRLDTEVDLGSRDEIGDLAQSFDAMRHSIKELVERQASAIDALSTPLIPFRDEVLIMPLVGELDERRIGQLQTTLIEGLHSANAQVAIIDLTGVPPFGEEVARGLVRAARGVRLMGAHVVMTGMKPELAKCLAQLEVGFDGIVVKQSLQSGLEWVMRETLGSE